MARIESECARKAEFLSGNAAVIEEILTAVATRASAQAEIEASVHVLQNVGRETKHLDEIEHGLTSSVFLPSNNLLYSLILYAAIPSTYLQTVRIRPSSRVKDIYIKLVQILGPILGSNVEFVDQTQREFVAAACDDDLIVFTGAPENGFRIFESLVEPKPLMLGFGSGPNPVVIGPEANVSIAVHDTAIARLYNGGQDCLCPDVIFVHRAVHLETIEKLQGLLSRVPVGDRSMAGLVNCSLIYPDAFDNAADYLERNSDCVVWSRGEISVEDSFIPITLLVQELDGMSPVIELFSPVLNLVVYDNPGDVRDWFEREDNLENGFYCSVYGEPVLDGVSVIGTTVNCGPASALDSEDGNLPFGGYGPGASWVADAAGIVGRPVLLSRELASLLRTRATDAVQVA